MKVLMMFMFIHHYNNLFLGIIISSSLKSQNKKSFLADIVYKTIQTNLKADVRYNDVR